MLQIKREYRIFVALKLLSDNLVIFRNLYLQNMQIFKTSVARKVAMALSAFFLILFLVIHLAVNFMSVLSEGTFNMLSHYKVEYYPKKKYRLQRKLNERVRTHEMREHVKSTFT